MYNHDPHHIKIKPASRAFSFPQFTLPIASTEMECCKVMTLGIGLTHSSRLTASLSTQLAGHLLLPMSQRWAVGYSILHPPLLLNPKVLFHSFQVKQHRLQPTRLLHPTNVSPWNFVTVEELRPKRILQQFLHSASHRVTVGSQITRKVRYQQGRAPRPLLHYQKSFSHIPDRPSPTVFTHPATHVAPLSCPCCEL